MRAEKLFEAKLARANDDWRSRLHWEVRLRDSGVSV